MSTWIVIPNRDGLRWLPDCLAGLERTVRGQAQVLVVDNGSAGGDRAWLAAQHPWAEVLPLAMNLGFVQATNLGVMAALKAGAAQVVLLNNDVRLEDGWLEALLRAAAAHPRVGVLGAWQTDFAGEDSPRSKAIAGTLRMGDSGQEVIPAEWVEGSCLLARREVWERVGLLDPIFAPAYFEEVDFCRRARAAGYGVALVRSSRIRHHGAGTSPAGPARQRQRVLLERNYLLFHAAGRFPLAALAARAARRIAKSFVGGPATPASPAETLKAVVGLLSLLPAVAAKARRDLAGLACPPLGERVPATTEQRYYAALAATLG